MKREDLTKMGLTDEAQIDGIMALHGKGIEKSKADLATLQASADALQAQLTEAGSTIEGFKKLDVEGIKAAANEWKVKAEKAQADSATQLSSLKFDHALDGALVGAKARNAKAVKALLQPDVLKDGNGEFIAERFNEQLATIKSENDYLFEDDTPQPKIVVGGNNKSILSDAVVDAARKAAGLRA